MTTQPLLHQELALQQARNLTHRQSRSEAATQQLQPTLKTDKRFGQHYQLRLVGWLRTIRYRPTRENHAAG